MTKFFYDCEFIEDGRTIDLISIGIVTADGREYYAVNEKAPWRRIKRHEWLMTNVVPSLPQGSGDWRNHMPKRWIIDFADSRVKPKRKIATQVQDFLLPEGRPHDDKIELWAYCGDYDHVVLMQLWGDMSRKPEGLPYYTKDLQQEIDRAGNPELPEQVRGQHNALDDARHNLVLARLLGIVS